MQPSINVAGPRGRSVWTCHRGRLLRHWGFTGSPGLLTSEISRHVTFNRSAGAATAAVNTGSVVERRRSLQTRYDGCYSSDGRIPSLTCICSICMPPILSLMLRVRAHSHSHPSIGLLVHCGGGALLAALSSLRVLQRCPCDKCAVYRREGELLAGNANLQHGRLDACPSLQS